MSRDALSALAATDDPGVLVRGDAASVAVFADRLAGFAHLLVDAADAMARADAGWRGAAGASFWERMTAATSAFRVAGDAFAEAAFAVRGYALELADARDLARLAAWRWAEGVRAAAAARVESAGSGGLAGWSGTGQDLWLRWEPAGSAERAEAVARLEAAWEQQDAAGVRATAGLARAMESAPQAAAWYETLAPTLIGLGAMGDSRKKRELAAGAGRGVIDLALVGGTNQWGTTDLVNRSLDRWERDHGLNPRSGVHETARFVAPMAVPVPGLGEVGAGGGAVARALSRSSQASIEASAGARAYMCLSSSEQAIATRARIIYGSEGLTEIRTAQAAGRSLEVTIDGTTVIYEPGLDASGMTLFGENGFVIGRRAFLSEGELAKTISHESYRLETSQSAGGVGRGLVHIETNEAFDFAEAVWPYVVKGF